MLARPRGRLSVYTLFSRLLGLPERIAALFGRHPAPHRPVRLGVEAMEERVVPDGRPLPNPVIYVGAGSNMAPVLKAYAADTGALKFATQVFESGFAGGVRVGAADFTGDGLPDAVVAVGPGHSPRIKIIDGSTGTQIGGPLGSFLAYNAGVTGGVYVAAADVNGDGHADVITSAVTDSGPKVKVFSGIDGSVLASFQVNGSAWADGASIAATDLNGVPLPVSLSA
jgi:hypothetical protein